jgi:hypothetical protein
LYSADFAILLPFVVVITILAGLLENIKSQIGHIGHFEKYFLFMPHTC